MENINKAAPAKEIQLMLEVNEVNLALAALQELPHKVSDVLIKKIIEQARTQI